MHRIAVLEWQVVNEYFHHVIIFCMFETSQPSEFFSTVLHGRGRVHTPSCTGKLRGVRGGARSSAWAWACACAFFHGQAQGRARRRLQFCLCGACVRIAPSCTDAQGHRDLLFFWGSLWGGYVFKQVRLLDQCHWRNGAINLWQKGFICVFFWGEERFTPRLRIRLHRHHHRHHHHPDPSVPVWRISSCNQISRFLKCASTTFMHVN